MVRLDLNLYPLNRGVVPVLPRKGKHVGGGGAARRTRRGVARASPPSTRLPSRSISLVCKGQQLLLLWELCIIEEEEVFSLPSCLPSLRCGWKLRTKRTGGDRIKGLWNEMMGLGDPLTSYLSGGSNNLDPRYCLLDFFVDILDLLTTPEMQRKERSRVKQRRRFRDTCVSVP